MQVMSIRSLVAFCLVFSACMPPLEEAENHIFDANEPVRYPRAPIACEFAPVRAAALRPQDPIVQLFDEECPPIPIDWTGPGQATCEEMRQVEHTISGIAGPVCDEFRAFCEGVLPSPCPPSAEIWLTDWPVDSPPFCVETGLFACGKDPGIRIQCCTPPL